MHYYYISKFALLHCWPYDPFNPWNIIRYSCISTRRISMATHILSKWCYSYLWIHTFVTIEFYLNWPTRITLYDCENKLWFKSFLWCRNTNYLLHKCPFDLLFCQYTTSSFYLFLLLIFYFCLACMRNYYRTLAPKSCLVVLLINVS